MLPYSITSPYSKYQNPKPPVFQTYKDISVKIDDKYEIQGKTRNDVMLKVTDKEATLFQTKRFHLKIFDKVVTRKRSLKQTLRELKILRLLDHENVINITSLQLPESREEFNELYVFSPVAETDLNAVINARQQLYNEHVQFFLYQALRGLKYVHSSGIIIQNLRPENLLINTNEELKISDFRFARFVHHSGSSYGRYDNNSTREISYMAPELLLGIKEYDFAQDIWSVGIIFAELLRRRPLVMPTCTETHIKNIFEIFETPSEEFIAKIPSKKMQKFVSSIENKNSVPLESLLPPETDDLAIDLLEKMLRIDWRERLTDEDALKHPYLKDLHYPYEEPVRDYLPKEEFEYENYKLSLDQLKDLLYEEILLYHFDDFKEEYNRKLANRESPFKAVIEKESTKQVFNKDSSDESD